MRRNKLFTACDLAWLPFSLGDFVLHQQAVVTACLELGLQAVDLCYGLLSGEHKDPTFNRYIGPENNRHCVLSLLRLVELNPLADQIRLIRQREEFEEVLEREAPAYGGMWPARGELERYFYYHGLRLMQRRFARTGSLPFLRAPEFLLRWARGFLAEHLPGRIPVTVNIRNNPRFAVERNADIETWLRFLEAEQARRPVGFMVVCATEEADPRFRDIPNVALAKDHNTDMLGDLALIDAAAAHVGMASGPSMKAILSQKPYFLTGTTSQLDQLGDLAQDHGGWFRFFFSGPDQKITHARETLPLLEQEFASMFRAIRQEPPEAFDAPGDGPCRLADSWLR